RRLRIAWLAGHRQRDLVVASGRVEMEIEGRDNASFLEKGDPGTLDFVAALVERDLAALEDGQRSRHAGLIWCSQHPQIGPNLRLCQIVVDEDWRVGDDVDVQ